MSASLYIHILIYTCTHRIIFKTLLDILYTGNLLNVREDTNN